MKKITFLFMLVVMTTGMAHAQFSVSINSDTICSGTSTTLTASVTGGTSPYSYHWNVGPTISSISVNPTSTTSYTCTVTDHNSLTATGQATVTVEYMPAQPSVIAGNIAPCHGSTETYSVSNASGVNYNWSFPAGWLITNGLGTSTVTVIVGINAGIISVSGSNVCGNGSAQTLNVTVTSPPLQPDSITGPLNPNPFSSATYGVTNVSGVTYSWTVPFNWTIDAGQGTSSIMVTVGTLTGCITVTPSNACGNGPSRTLCFGSTGLKEIPSDKSEALNIIPNPASGNVNIIYTDEAATSLQIKVINLSGIIDYTGIIEHFSGRYSESIDLGFLPEGVYFVRMITENGIAIKRLVLIR